MKSSTVKVVVGIVVVLAIVFAGYGAFSFKYIQSGEVGVVYSMKDGVQSQTLNPGAHFVAPFDRVTSYPVSQQQLVFSNNPADYGKKEHADWHIDAPTDGGMVMLNATISYSFMPDRVTSLYTRFNGMDGGTIVDSMLQNTIIAYIKEVTAKYSVTDINSSKRAEVGVAITDYLNSKLNDEYGIKVASALIIDVQLDPVLQDKIRAKEQAKADAEKAELDAKTAKAQAEVTMVNAKVEADIKKVRAEADADRTRIEAQAQADANRLVSQSLTPELIQMKEAEARLKHGWVTVQGASTVVTDATQN